MKTTRLPIGPYAGKNVSLISYYTVHKCEDVRTQKVLITIQIKNNMHSNTTKTFEQYTF